MKKCPQCGTILEESKKKCYMCGAELQKMAFDSFGDTFDEQIGATVTHSQDNVFSSVGNVMGGAEGTISNNSNEVALSSSMNSADKVHNQIGKNLPSKYDNRTAIEKIFSTDSRYKQDVIDFNDSAQDDFSNNHQCLESTPMVPLPPKTDDADKKDKPSINWGDNLKKSQTIEEVNEKKKFNFNTLFNLLSVVIFFVTVIFLYFKFIAPSTKPTVEEFGGLSYEIDKDFVLESEAGGIRYYSYGSACALKVSYGPTVETQGFLDNYFEQVKASFSNSKTSLTEMTINGNTWTEIRVFDFEQNAAASNGYAEVLRYKYVAIVHKGNFYDIVFANDSDDNKCSAMFDKFQQSLSLK